MKRDKRLLLHINMKNCSTFQIFMLPTKNLKKVFCILPVLSLLFFCPLNISGQANKFTVVIDAGHGGHDPGAIGAITREKDINLGISLRLGELIHRNFPDVKVVFTRKTDIFLPLQERADIVNANNADLFICVHTNSAQSSSAYGAETFTLGLAKTKSNLDVAMRENSVMLLEKDYKTKYKGFDPNSVDSYIMFEFMQDKYIDKSIEIAQNIQKQFVSYSKRSDRGVRQAGFWVLHRSACPSVLVEVGFISNPSEERYLASDNGKQEMATAIYNAFVKFKREHDKKSGRFTTDTKYEEITQTQTPVITETAKEDKNNKNTVAENSSNSEKQNKDTDIIATAFDNEKGKTKTTETKTQEKSIPVYKVQILASQTKLKTSASEFKGLSNIDFYTENNLYKYTVGAETDYNKIVELRKTILKQFPESFIIAFVGDKKLTVKEAQKLTHK